MDINIRNAIATDYPALCELFEEVDALHRVNLPHLFQKPHGSAREMAEFLELITDENVGLFIAERDDKLLGFVHVIVREAPPIPIFVLRRYAVIDNLGVKSEYRRHGIGQMLMSTAQKWALAKGATAIELNVYEFNQTAIAFYHRLGYEDLSRKMIKRLDK
ncbi:MAG: GNAT family N-acetyltransferase [Anaerolineales bacterium]